MNREDDQIKKQKLKLRPRPIILAFFRLITLCENISCVTAQ